MGDKVAELSYNGMKKNYIEMNLTDSTLYKGSLTQKTTYVILLTGSFGADHTNPWWWKSSQWLLLRMAFSWEGVCGNPLES